MKADGDSKCPLMSAFDPKRTFERRVPVRLPAIYPRLAAIALSFGIFASPLVDAADQYKVAIPATSTLTQAPQVGPDAYVEFRGQATLQVRYRFIYEPDDRDPLSLLFMPDEASLERLPYLVERTQPERPTTITVRNPKDAAGALLGKELASQLKGEKQREFSGSATVVIGDFAAGYDCDSPSFGARFVSLQQIIVAASATPAQDKEGC